MSLIITTGDSAAEVSTALEHLGLQADSVEVIGPPVETVVEQADPNATAETQVQTETPAPTTTVVETPTEPADKTATATETVEEGQEQPRGADGKFLPKEPDAVPAGVQKRIDRLVAKQRDAERKLAESEAKLATLQAAVPAKEKTEPVTTKPAPAEESKTAKPKLDDQKEDGTPKYASYEEWVESLTDWKSDQKEAKLRAELDTKLTEREAAAKAAEHQATAVEVWTTRVEAEKAKHTDWDEVMATADDEKLSATPVMQNALNTSDLGPALLYHLVSHPEECRKIMALPDVAAVLAIGRIEAGLASTQAPVPKAPVTPKPKLSSAPAPITPVGGTVVSNPGRPKEVWTLAQYEQWKATPEGQRWSKGSR